MTLKNEISSWTLLPLSFLIGEKLGKKNPKCPHNWRLVVKKIGCVKNGINFLMIWEKKCGGMEKYCGIFFKKQLQTLVRP